MIGTITSKGTEDVSLIISIVKITHLPPLSGQTTWEPQLSGQPATRQL